MKKRLRLPSDPPPYGFKQAACDLFAVLLGGLALYVVGVLLLSLK